MGVVHFKITSLPHSSVHFVQNYVPTVFENYTASFEIDTQRIELSLWDTSGKRVIRPRGARAGFQPLGGERRVSGPQAWHALTICQRAISAGSAPLR